MKKMSGSGAWRGALTTVTIDPILIILIGRYTKLQGQYNDAFKAMQEQKQLIAQLEEDLRSVNALSSMFRGDAEVSIQFE